ncbi:MAG: prenyltransferase [Candidatus Omnitrophota bacterium]
MMEGDRSSRGISNFVRALRLPFITASILPFIAGSFAAKGNFRVVNFFLGAGAAALTHLGANLLNDYADSRSGADWHDKKFYGFFGGSKLIQEGVFPERFYLNTAVLCFSSAFICISTLFFILRNSAIIGFYFLILFLGVCYSVKPLQFSYKKLGELIIFLLFGPVPVMGGYFIQTGVFPAVKPFLLSVPFGLLTAAILFANEIPDYEYDEKSSKRNLVSLLGPEKSYILYMALVISAFVFIIINIREGYLSAWAYFSFLFLTPAFKAAAILKKSCFNREEMIKSSQLTILTQTMAGIMLIIGIVL